MRSRSAWRSRARRSPIARLLSGALLLGALIGCAAASERFDVQIGGTTLSVAVADTPESREHGLMRVTDLGEREGMLFVFPSSEPRAFWMKNTPLRLSIAYIDERWTIREIHDMQPLSLEPVPSREPARYALEVNQGAFDRLGIGVGDRLNPSSELRDRIGY